ncbi:hypothetical protein [Phyllobacterium sp. SB3]|uniref:hypothetical protein n=1 Tax=Phyllobacterium sp. SB3 TaxID=3156073 RepID=UPI0032AF7FCE
MVQTPTAGYGYGQVKGLQGKEPDLDLENCRFCSRPAKLSKSHCIPDYYFRKTKSKGHSMFVTATDKARVIKTVDSGASPLLCSQCESDFNRLYDKPLRKLTGTIYRSGGMLILVDASRLTAAIVSVLWRASVSTSNLYKPYAVSGTVVVRSNRCHTCAIVPI